MPASLSDHLGTLLTVIGVLAHDDVASLVGVKHIPALALAQGAILVLLCVRVIRVHLDGEVALGVQDLD